MKIEGLISGVGWVEEQNPTTLFSRITNREYYECWTLDDEIIA